MFDKKICSNCINTSASCLSDTSDVYNISILPKKPQKNKIISDRSKKESQRKKLRAEYVANLRHPKKGDPKKCAQRQAKRRAIIKNAMPIWVDKNLIDKVYQEKPIGVVVDHIIPLSNKNICGLHVPWNLQYLTKEENIRKNNKFDGTFSNEKWRKL